MLNRKYVLKQVFSARFIYQPCFTTPSCHTKYRYTWLSRPHDSTFRILENYHCCRFHGSDVTAAPQIRGLFFLCWYAPWVFFRSSMCFRVPHLCSKIPKIYNWSMDSGVHSVCASVVISPLRQWLDSYAKTCLKMWHTFKNFNHMQYFMLPTNLVIVFVHWVSTGVL